MAVAQWVRGYSSNHKVVQGEVSRPHKDVYEVFFSNDFLFQFYVRPDGLQ